MAFEYTIDMKNNTVCSVALSGTIDPDAYNELKESMRKVVEGSRKAVIFDMADLKYIDSTGLAAILSVRKDLEEKGGVLVLASLQKRIKDVINVTRIVKEENIFDTYDEAYEGLKELL